MSSNSQLHLTNDSFLYACQSEFAARTKKDGTFKSHIRFEAFLLGDYKRPGQATMRDFSELVNAITAHHAQATPQFRRNESLNLDTVSYFTCAIATLFADLEEACKVVFGLGLPIIPSEPPEYSAEAPLSNALIQKRNQYLSNTRTAEATATAYEAFPLKEVTVAEEALQSSIWSCEVWDTIADAIHSKLGQYADTAMGFAYWKYQETHAKAEIDWRVRPPVGEAYAKAFKPMQRSARGERGDRGDRHGRDGRGGAKGPGADRRPAHDKPRAERGERTERGDRGEVRSSEHRPQHTEAQADHRSRGVATREAPRGALESGERQHRRRENFAPEGGDSPRREHRRERAERPSGQGSVPTSSEAQLQDALQEVQSAIAALKQNPGRGEVALKPNNSFIRRQQHSLAVELGFDTESRGEGRERGVVIRSPGLPG
ncbi:MAG: hypothetical protein FJY29_11485 [Betaproteobacteria bacterium]|nr:hypothetical protein [Betaproteobacteria bacterium]